MVYDHQTKLIYDDLFLEIGVNDSSNFYAKLMRGKIEVKQTSSFILLEWNSPLLQIRDRYLGVDEIQIYRKAFYMACKIMEKLNERTGKNSTGPINKNTLLD